MTVRARSSPFADVTPSVVAALVFAAASAVWVIGGDGLPGGRWLAVHLFTLGVLSNVVLAFTGHFTDTLTKVPADSHRGRWVLTFNAGAVAVMVGMVQGWPIVVATGATTATVAVMGSYLRLRRARRRALGARFAWVVRAYERAHGAFVHGAILGGLLGAGMLAGPWYAAGRVAHLHINLLGWAGVTLLATLVFFGPTMVRTRIQPGADEQAARTIRVGAYAVSVASVALLASGFGAVTGTLFRIVAGLALAVFAWTSTSVCRAVRRAVATAGPGAARSPLTALCWWVPLLLWVDAVVVAAGWWPLLDALGLGLLLGVFVQAVATTLVYLTPLLMGDHGGSRARLHDALDRHAGARAVVFNAGVAALVGVVATSAGGSWVVVTRLAWAAVLLALVQPVAATMQAR